MSAFFHQAQTQTAGAVDFSRGDIKRFASAVGPRVMPVHHLLANLCVAKDCTFVREGVLVDPLVVMSPEMFLPVIAWTAQEAGQRLLGANLGCVLRKDSIGLFGVRCVVPAVTAHIADVVRSLFFIHFATELFGLRDSALIEVHPMSQMLTARFEHLIEKQTPSPDGLEGEIQWPQLSRTN